LHRLRLLLILILLRLLLPLLLLIFLLLFFSVLIFRSSKSSPTSTGVTSSVTRQVTTVDGLGPVGTPVTPPEQLMSQRGAHLHPLHALARAWYDLGSASEGAGFWVLSWA